MLTPSDIAYYIIYTFCLYFSFRARRSNIPGLNILRLLLCCGLVNEIAVEIRQYLKFEENLSHYFYIPIEYILLVFYYIKNTDNKYLKNAMKLSLIIYLI